MMINFRTPFKMNQWMKRVNKSNHLPLRLKALRMMPKKT